jgi:hypothetical protein
LTKDEDRVSSTFISRPLPIEVSNKGFEFLGAVTKLGEMTISFVMSG